MGDDLTFAAFGLMIHHDQDALGADGQIHRASHRGNRIRCAGVPVGEVAGGGHLERAEHAKIEMPAAHHRERIGVMEIGAAGEQGDRLLAGVDQVGILGAGGWRRTHTEQTVFAVQEDLALFRQVIGDHGRQADAQIDVGAFRNVARDTGGHLLPGEALHGRSLMRRPAAPRAGRQHRSRRCVERKSPA